VKITIKNKSMSSAVIITFRTDKSKFESNYERIKFFKNLHGWKQTVPKNGKKYTYKRSGLLDEIPHMKLADSVFAIAEEHMERMEEFFELWEEKVDYEIMEIMTSKNFLRKRFENFHNAHEDGDKEEILK
jgi:glutaredoxin-related protein